MEVSIIIPTYNRLDFIKRTLESIEVLNYPIPDFEVIVVDDGSTDGTKECLEKYSKITGLNFRFITQKNAGPATARNTGLKHTKGKFVAYTDSDCIVDRNWLHELLKGFSSENIAAVGGSVRGVGNDIFSRYFAQTALYNTRVIDGNVIYLLTLNACFRKEIISDLGGFNEKFKRPGGEDPELCLRIRKKGYSLGYRVDAIVHHHHKSNFKSFIRTFKNYGEGLALLVKWHPEWYKSQDAKDSFSGVRARKFYRQCKENGLGFKRRLTFAVLHYLQYAVFYLKFLRERRRFAHWQVNPIPKEKLPDLNSIQKTIKREMPQMQTVQNTQRPEHMNVVIPFRKGDQSSAKLLLELLLAVDEGIDCTYYIQYFDSEASLSIFDTTLKFLNKKRAYFSNELPDIRIPERMIKEDPNMVRYPEYAGFGTSASLWWISKPKKFEMFEWNFCIFKYLQKLDSFLLMEPDSVILKHGWLRDIYEVWKNYNGPIFGHLKKGKIGGKFIPTHWTKSSVYDSTKLRSLPLKKYFYERYQNPWWQFITQKDTSLVNNCFWGPMFSGYDISYDYFLFGLYWKEKTGSNNPQDWPLHELLSHEDLILGDLDSKMKSSVIIEQYFGKISMIHGVKVDDIRELMLRHFLSAGILPTNQRLRGGPDCELNDCKYYNILNLKNKYRGNRCFIIGNGPSLNKTNLTLLKNEYTVGVNRIYLNYDNMGFEPTFYCVVNPNVIEQFCSEIDRLNTIKFLRKSAERFIKNKWNTFFMRDFNHIGFDFNKNLETLRWYEGWTVTYCAMQVAFHLGFTTVILVGVDHFFKEAGEPNKHVIAQADDPNHFHTDYFGKGIKWQYPDLERSEQAYRIAKKVYEEDGRVILDATVGGHLQVFPKVDYLTVVSEKIVPSQHKYRPEVRIPVEPLKQIPNIPSVSYISEGSRERIRKLDIWLQKLKEN